MHLSQSMPNLNDKFDLVRLDDKQLERGIRYLEMKIEEIFQEYNFMDNPIKTMGKTSITLTIDEILWSCLTE